MKFRFLILLSLCLVLIAAGFVFAKGGGDNVCTNSIYSKHAQMAGGDCNRCLECHCKTSKDDKCGQAYAPTELKGRYANMGGPNHSCGDCHNGVKAVLLPASSCIGSAGCATCHY